MIGTEPTPSVDQYGRYQIVRKLATGGMGEVYLAKSIGAAGFQKRVVIKRLLPHLVQHHHFVEGLVNEAKLLVMLDHPNIVQVLDLGREGDDYFMAMEYVHGYNMATIAHYCAQQRVLIPAAACCYIGLQVLAGLEYAHDLAGSDGRRHNIIHRDVSPQNVLISRQGRVKLADFGIAKVLTEAEAEVTTSLKGKFRYMAPEAVDGGRIDHRYDLFAVGILLFEALCRRHLFAGRSDVDILNQVRAVKIPPIERYHPGVQPELVAVTKHALGKRPEDRFQSATAFANALREVLPVTENEAARQLGQFIDDLYERDDFPINKPKLPDLDAVDPDVTRSVILHSRIEANRSTDVAAEPVKRGGGMVFLWAGFFMISAAVAYLAYALLIKPTGQSKPQDPVIIKVTEKKSPDADVSAAANDVRAHASLDRAVPMNPKTKVKRPPRPRPTFTEAMGQHSFAKAGRRLRRCFDKHIDPKKNPEVSLGVASIIRADGRVTDVKLKPSSREKTPLGRCIKAVAAKIRYPRHNKPTVTFFQPLRVRLK